jgi:TRAP transporter TAXI family solute receptor
MKAEILSQGDVFALPLMAHQELDLVVLTNDVQEYAFEGKGLFGRQSRGKGFDLRVLSLGMPAAAGMVVAGNSGIRDYQGLKGKRVVLDYATQEALTVGSRASLVAGGLTEQDVIVKRASNIENAVQMVLEGKADAVFGGIGVNAFHGFGSIGLLYLETGDKHWDEVHRISRAYFPMKVDKGPGVTRETTLLGRHVSLATRADLPEETAYRIVKALWANDAEQLRDWVKSGFVNELSTAPYHPGAIRFYSEMGAWSGAIQARQNKLLTRNTWLAER